jgi:hypothetical protein
MFSRLEEYKYEKKKADPISHQRTSIYIQEWKRIRRKEKGERLVSPGKGNWTEKKKAARCSRALNKSAPSALTAGRIPSCLAPECHQNRTWCAGL